MREEISAGLDIRLVHLAADPLPAEWVAAGSMRTASKSWNGAPMAAAV